MSKSNFIKLEYIWLDGDEREPSLRSKTKVIWAGSSDSPREPDAICTMGENIPVPRWTFDGSSTMQAEGSSSDCVLNPVKIVFDPTRKKGYLVMCEVLDATGSPHVSNTRKDIDEYLDFEAKPQMWFGFEQEYIINNPDTGRPLGFPRDGFPNPQGQYYCGVGNINVKAREFVEEHMDLCLDAGLNITGVNGEVMIGQWEYQLLVKNGAKDAADDLWLSRYLLQRLGEEYGFNVTFHPKPIKGNWNGSGLHTNFSSFKMRKVEISDGILDELKKNHKKDIQYYGAYNELRLTGDYETQSIEKFSVGVSDRGASIRIPLETHINARGYLEDRRPASNADPYNLVRIITNNVKNGENDN